ncbi:glycoside hydrolase family 3 protein [Streptococcus merionis]|uniref:glycoside hydrolase family 3 protein n=1 Tax=Streptococcus merionis TaxID=400065 RepID=UPI0026EC96EB|nr:glycoside hydrolase family 3 N-terminal domain-containing protein [Streptococcus merionis]
MVNVKEKPFYLDETSEQWVKNTLANMTLDEKLGQIFIQLAQPDTNYLDKNILGRHVGGILFRQNEGAVIQDSLRYIQSKAKIPVLFCGNLEEGGIGLAKEGTYFSKQMETAATSNPDFAYKNGLVIGREATALGAHLSFGPVVDIALDWRSAITSTNAFSSDVDKVLDFASANMRGQMEEGLATAVKHFPGEGTNDHDQHYFCEVNEMSVTEWDQTFGKIFKSLINQGTLAIMPGHIALPAYQKLTNPDFGDQVLPATYSKELLTTLLREQLGFNGLVVSDNTCIAGGSAYLPRWQAIPQMVAAGIDLILYSFDMDEDIGFLKEALADGRLTEERLDEAVTRNLATKAALQLHEKQSAGSLVPKAEALEVLSCEEHLEWARACADKAVTLVKDESKLLPITPEKYQKIYLTIISDPWERQHLESYIRAQLEARGFVVSISDPKSPIPSDNSIAAWKAKYDLLLYIAHQESARKDKTTLRINWSQAGNVPRLAADIPTAYVSFGNPFDLYDVPMIKTYVNAYCATDIVIDETMKKIVGERQFKGVNPVDPFCGKWYLKV